MIVEKNVDYSTGEVDLIMLKQGVYYLIEVKNYGPWHSREGNVVYYIGSGDFQRRSNKLQYYINKLPTRLLFVKEHKASFKIPENCEISRGLIITPYKECFIQIPLNFQILSIDEFKMFLGYDVKRALEPKIDINPILKNIGKYKEIKPEWERF